MKVFMKPSPEARTARVDGGGIARVVEAYGKYGPEYGIEYVVKENQAELVASHAGAAGIIDLPLVAHVHGLYPTGEVGAWAAAHHETNRRVIDDVRHANIVTVPSEWVAQLFRRDMRFNPEVLPHGIDIDDWKPGKPQGYILWNKNRPYDVCDPTPVNELAKRLKGMRFVTTFGEHAANVDVLGAIAHDQMRKIVSEASIYLATTKETFGIGTLEAMACGVPIVGYRWGGTADIVQHGENGWLVTPGDIDGLMEGLVMASTNWKAWSDSARHRAERFGWEKVVARLAEIYSTAIMPVSDLVSIVIPCYNYADYVGQAIDSALTQTHKQIEIIVVDDGSADNSLAVINKYARNKRVRIISQTNQGVAAARNNGLAIASGAYCVCLDADDALEPNFVEQLLPSLKKDHSMGISFGGLRLVFKEGEPQPNHWPGIPSFDQQVDRKNQIPSVCMFRKEAWKRAGGFRQRYIPAEDAEFWLKIGEVGYGYIKATDEPVYRYRLHDQSATQQIRMAKKKEPDWTDFHQGLKTDPPFAAQIALKPTQPAVINYDRPFVSVIIPVGPGHEELVRDSIDSVLAQSFRGWEVIVVDDATGVLERQGTPELKTAYPFAVFCQTIKPQSGPAVARNTGAAQAKGQFVMFLDADDMLEPRGIELLLSAVGNPTDKTYAYGDWYDESRTIRTAEDFDCNKLITKAIHPITALVPTWIFKQSGGFDTAIKGFEDWEWFTNLVTHGVCGYRVAAPILTYRYSTGMRRETDIEHQPKILAQHREKYADFFDDNGRANMACGGCGKKPRPMLTPMVDVQTEAERIDNMQMVKLASGMAGAIMIVGPATGKRYGYRANGDEFYVEPADILRAPERFVLV